MENFPEYLLILEECRLFSSRGVHGFGLREGHLLATTRGRLSRGYFGFAGNTQSFPLRATLRVLSEVVDLLCGSFRENAIPPIRSWVSSVDLVDAAS